jgi:beta-glucosidase
LSYTRFAYEGLNVPAARAGEAVRVAVRVKNDGEWAGSEIVQVYLEHLSPAVRAPQRQLAGMRRIHLEPGESRDVKFMIRPEQFALIDDEGRPTPPRGPVRITVGGSQPDEHSASLGAAPPISATLTFPAHLA